VFVIPAMIDYESQLVGGLNDCMGNRSTPRTPVSVPLRSP
jgi:hypothetical protein